MPDTRSPEDTAEGPAACYHCHAPVSPEQERCPHCGARQSRMCFCGTVYRKALAACPQCGQAWTETTRERRRSRSRRLRVLGVLQYAGVGASLALLLAVVLNLAVTSLAQRASPGADLSQQPWTARVAAAGEELWGTLTGAGRSTAQAARAALPLLGVFGLGALAGAGAFVWRTRAWVGRRPVGRPVSRRRAD